MINRSAGGLRPGYLPDGTAADPSLSFEAETTTGMYRIGAGLLGFAALGAVAFSAIAVPSAVNRVEAVPGATGSPSRVGLRAAGSDANISLVLMPKGSGAIIAHFPDSAITGGNARGANATDMQTVRVAANQVASGVESTIGGGSNNLANATATTVAGGRANTANANSSTVGGGLSNTASGAQSVVSGGTTNAASGAQAAVGGGTGNIASGASSTVGGGFGNLANGVGSWIPGGVDASTRNIRASGAWAGASISSLGDTQARVFVMSAQTANATPLIMTSDRLAQTTQNHIVLANFSLLGGSLCVAARQQGAANFAVWIIDLAVQRGNGVGTVALVGGGGAGLVPTFSGGTGSAWRVNVAVDVTFGSLIVEAVGAAAATINWHGRFDASEVVTTS